MNRKIDIRSIQGKGTTVSVQFPKVMVPDTQAAPPRKDGNGPIREHIQKYPMN